MIPKYPRGQRVINYGAKLSEIEKDFIYRNAKTASAARIAVLLGKSYALIYQYCRNHGIECQSDKRGRKTNEEREAVGVKPDPKRKYLNTAEWNAQLNGNKKMVRPPAKYDNRSQQDVIDHYLKLEI